MANPHPTPTVIKNLKGDTRKQKKNPAEPKFDPAENEPPLRLNPVARVEWDRIFPVLQKAGVVTVVDTLALHGYCVQVAIYDKANQMIDDHGTLVKSLYKNGPPTQNPYLPIQRKAQELIIKLSGELGITPASRTRVVAVPTKPKDGYESKKSKRLARVTDIKEKMKQNIAFIKAKAKAIRAAANFKTNKKPPKKETPAKQMRSKKVVDRKVLTAKMKAKMKKTATKKSPV